MSTNDGILHLSPLQLEITIVEELEFANFGAPPFIWFPLLGNTPVQSNSNLSKIFFRQAQQAWADPNIPPEPEEPPGEGETVTQEELDQEAAEQQQINDALLALNTALFEDHVREVHEHSRWRSTIDGHFFRFASSTGMLVNVSKEGGHIEEVVGLGVGILSPGIGNALPLWVTENDYHKLLIATGAPNSIDDRWGEIINSTEITIGVNGAESPPLPQVWPDFLDEGIQQSFENDMTEGGKFAYGFWVENFGTIHIREIIGLADQAKADAIAFQDSQYGLGSTQFANGTGSISFPQAPNTIVGVFIRETNITNRKLEIIFYVAIGAVFAFSNSIVPVFDPETGEFLSFTSVTTGAQEIRQKVTTITYDLAEFPIGFNEADQDVIGQADTQATFAGTYQGKNALMVTSTGNLGFNNDNLHFKIYEISNNFTLRGNPYIPITETMSVRKSTRNSLGVVSGGGTPIYFPVDNPFNVAHEFVGGLQGNIEVGGLSMRVPVDIVLAAGSKPEDGELSGALNFDNSVDGVFIVDGQVATIINFPIDNSAKSTIHNTLKWRQYFSWDDSLKDGDPAITWDRIPVLLRLVETEVGGAMLFELWNDTVWESRVGFKAQPLKVDTPSGGAGNPTIVEGANYTPLGRGGLVEIKNSSYPFVITGENAGAFRSWDGVGNFELGGGTSGSTKGTTDQAVGFITLYRQSTFHADNYVGPLSGPFGQTIQANLTSIDEQVDPIFDARYLRNRDYTNAVAEYSISNDPDPSSETNSGEFIYYFEQEEEE